MTLERALYSFIFFVTGRWYTGSPGGVLLAYVRHRCNSAAVSGGPSLAKEIYSVIEYEEKKLAPRSQGTAPVGPSALHPPESSSRDLQTVVQGVRTRL